MTSLTSSVEIKANGPDPPVGYNDKDTGRKGGAIKSTELSKRWKEIKWPDVFDGKITSNRLFVRSAIIRKDLLPRFASKHQLPSKCVDSVEDVKSFIDQLNRKNSATFEENSFPTESEETSCKNNVGDSRYCGYVLKPTDSSNAFGVVFFDDPLVDARVRESLATHGTMVLQPYPKPYLYGDKYKFHIRTMMLLVGDLDVYVHKKPRVLIATNDWVTNHHNWVDELTHITNQSANRKSKEYDESKQNVKFHGPQCGFPPEFLAESFLQMKNIVKALFKDILDEETGAKKSEFLPLRTTYELFGIDFLIDKNGIVYLLEINPEPSMKLFHMEKQEQMVGTDPFVRVPSTFTRVYSKQMLNALKLLRKHRG